MPWAPLHWEDELVGVRICHNWIGSEEIKWHSSLPLEVSWGPPCWLLAVLSWLCSPGRCAQSPGRVFSTPRSTPPTPQRQPAPRAAVPSPRPSPGPGPSGRVFRTYDEQLRLAMELSAQEQEERRRRVRQEEEELERILQLSLTEQ